MFKQNLKIHEHKSIDEVSTSTCPINMASVLITYLIKGKVNEGEKLWVGLTDYHLS